MGFKTFDGFIDESYDDEPDESKRIHMIYSEITRLCAMSKEEIQHWINRWSKLKGPRAEAVVNIWKKHLKHRNL